MKRINFNKIVQALKNGIIYVGILITFLIMMLLMPNEGKFKYLYHKGRPWMYETLMAPFDFPILKTEQELLKEREDALQKIVPYYKIDNTVQTSVLLKILQLQIKNEISQEIENNLENSINKIYSIGILPKDDVLRGAASYITVQKDKRASEQLLDNFYTPEKAVRFLKSELIVENPLLNVDSIFNAIKISELIVPNLIYDQNATTLLHKDAIDYISPTKGMVYTGELIVSKGEIITSDIAQLIDSYKSEYKINMGNTDSMSQRLASHAIIIIIILSLIYITVFFVNPSILRAPNRFVFLLFIVLLVFVITVAIKGFGSQYYFMIPYAVCALYMSAFFKSALVFPTYMLALIPLLIIAENGVVLYILNVFSGGLAILLFSAYNRGWLQFFNSFLIFIGLFLAYLSFELLSAETFTHLNLTIVLYLFLNALFVVATYPLTFLFEKVFGLVSVSTLKDLSDTNNKALQELSRKAPGTFQHSLQVANLAERAVAEIGGNSRLVKVGAMYHDIGKLYDPQCFIENEAPGINYHKGLTPQESAKRIISHVSEGVNIAKKYRLPQIIINFITSHHGHSQTLFFYNQYCKEGGNPENKNLFTYSGSLPATKEEVVVMMADAVEAASRTLKDYSAESISNLVDGILSKRISDEQLINANISIKEINIVKEAFKKHLIEIYHARIEYPKEERKFN